MKSQDMIIPPQYFKDSKFENLELQLFSDASPKAYAAVAYFRIKYPAKISTKFVMAKSRGTHVKTVTLPMLEFKDF